MPIQPIREAFERLLNTDAAWDRRVGHIQIVEPSAYAMQVRFLLSAGNSITLWYFWCRVREAMLHFTQREYPEYLPTMRAQISDPT